MSYVCRKALNFSGTQYKPGDVIPDGVILPQRVRSLIAVGMISGVETEGTEESTPVADTQPVTSDIKSTISISVNGENGDVVILEVTPEEIQEAFSILQMTANEGISEIANVDSENVLIMIHATDSRKTVLNAAKERADVISPTEAEKDAPSGDNEATEDNTGDTTE